MPGSNPFGSTQRLPMGVSWGHVVTVPSLRLAVVEGPDRGCDWIHTLATVIVGKSPECDVVLTDPAVSRRQVSLTRTPTGLRLDDLGSTNGTFVSDARVVEAVLTPPARFRVGSTVIEITAGTHEYHAPDTNRVGLGGLIGASDAMREMYSLIEAVGPTPTTVLVRGESGTGKELVARNLHELSGRSGPLVVFDCTTASAELVRSELFGHVRGAFTGAETDRTGAFRQAHGGTLFLDELGELPLPTQAMLLRVLESRCVTPLGSDQSHPVDVRLVAATHRDLAALTREGKFREDLYFRLTVIEVTLPPLRERSRDIPLIVEHLRQSLAPETLFPHEVLERLTQYPWTGNVRQLRNAVERLGILARGRAVTLADLAFLGATGPAPAPLGARPSDRLEDLETETILRVFREQDGNVRRAAEVLGLGLTTLKTKLKQYRDAGLLPRE